MDMLLAVLSVCSPEELEDDSSSDDGEADRALIDQTATAATRRARRQRVIKNKILALGKMQLMFQNLRYAARAPRRWTYTHVRHVQ
jgi:serine/threonine-protein phosphatase 2B catalytic subunit